MKELTFDGAQPDDVPLVEEILTDATQHKINHGDQIWGSEGWTTEEVQEAMSESEVYIVRQGDEVIGTVSLQWEDTRNWGEQPPVAGYMHRLAIKDGYHGQDLGKQIVDWAAAKTVERGRQLLRLDCEESNTALCAYYEQQGFVKVGTRPVPEYGDYVAALYERPVAG